MGGVTFPDLGIDVGLLWDGVVSILLSIGPLMALLIGIGLAFWVIERVVGIVRRLVGDR